MPIHPCSRVVMTALKSRIIYVDSAATGDDDGSTWANAFANLQDGIAAWAAGKEIWVAGAATTGKTYKPDGASAGTRTLYFTPPAGCAIYGGFVGTETRRGQRDPWTNLTILSGDIGAAVGDRSYHVVYIAGAGVLLDGLIIEKGNADSGTTTTARGGGIYADGAGLMLKNIIVRDCFSIRRGGGIYLAATASGAVIDNSIILRNSTYPLVDTGATVDEAIDATETEFTTAYGDYLTRDSGYFKIDDEWCYYAAREETVISGIVRGALGTVATTHATATALYEHASNNLASTDGGGLNTDCFSALSATITNTQFIGNHSYQKGGGIKLVGNAAASIVVSDCVFDGNVAALENGGLGAGTGNGEATKCVFINNIAMIDDGGAASVKTLTNCTAFNNSVYGAIGVGGVRLQTDGSAINCIFYGNHGAGGIADDIAWEEAATGVSVTYTATGAEVTGTGNIILEADPFVDSTDPIGADLKWWTADDGLRIPAESALLTAGSTGGEIGAYG